MTCKREIYNISVSHRLAAFLTLLSLATIFLFHSIIPTIEPDSENYLNMDASRPVLYPLFLRIGGFFGDVILGSIILQVMLYLGSFYYLVLTLHRTFNSLFVTLLTGTATALNIYMQTFHTTILTESLAFTLMNGIIIILLQSAFSTIGLRRHQIVLFGVITGLLIALKPALTSLLPAILLIVAAISFSKQSAFYRQTGLVLVLILGVLGLDRLTYQLIHQEKDSLSQYILFGKAAMLSTDPHFQMPRSLSGEDRAFYKKVAGEFAPYKTWFSSDENRLIKSNIRANIEVYAQFQLYPHITNRDILTHDDKARMRRLGQAAILENPLAYLWLSLSHLTELWSVQALPFVLMTTDSKLPEFGNQRLNSVLPQVAHSGSALDPTAKTTTNKLALVVFPAFAALGLINFCLLFVFMTISGKRLFWHKQALTSTEIIMTSLLIIGWSNLVFIAFVNIPTPRYLMPHFTSFVLTALLAMSWLMSVYETRTSDTA